MFLKVIACEVAFREVCACAARSVNLLDLEFLTQGYHDNPDIGIGRIQERIDGVAPGRFDGILVGYGLCNNMLVGLKARHTPLIVPRAHDCITFFLGSKERYQKVFLEHPGTYYYTAGWLEHRGRGGERVERKQGAGLGKQRSFEEMVAKYGEDNARYLMETMNAWTQHYTRGVFIDFEFTAHLPVKERAREICRERGWVYEELRGDLTLLQDWLDGRWSDRDFLVVRPGEGVVATWDEQIIQIEPIRKGGLP